MRILGIESASLVASVAIVTDDVITAEYTVNLKKTHSQTLLPMIDEIVKMLEVPLESIDAIAVSGGPGSFTGLRIGSATAKGLGLALKKPLIHVPTMDAMGYCLYGASALICPTATPHPTFPPARAASRQRNSPPGCASTCIMTTPTRSLKSPSKTPSTRTTPTRCWKQTRNEPDNVKCPAGRSSRAACGAFFMLSCSCASGRNGTPCRPGCAGCWNGASR